MGDENNSPPKAWSVEVKQPGSLISKRIQISQVRHKNISGHNRFGHIVYTTKVHWERKLRRAHPFFQWPKPLILLSSDECQIIKHQLLMPKHWDQGNEKCGTQRRRTPNAVSDYWYGIAWGLIQRWIFQWRMLESEGGYSSLWHVQKIYWRYYPMSAMQYSCCWRC